MYRPSRYRNRFPVSHLAVSLPRSELVTAFGAETEHHAVGLCRIQTAANGDFRLGRTGLSKRGRLVRHVPVLSGEVDNERIAGVAKPDTILVISRSERLDDAILVGSSEFPRR